MLRIEAVTGPDGASTISLEGRMVGPWVDVLERSVNGVRGRALRLDCARLAFADREGVALLVALAEEGAAIVNAPALLAEQLRAWRGVEPSRRVEALLDRVAARGYRVAHGITRDEAVAGEVVRDALAGALASDGAGAPAAFEAAVDRAVVAGALARARWPVEPLALPAFDADGHRAGAAETDVDWSARPDADVLGRPGATALADALDRLPAPARAVVLLRDVEGLSPERTASVLGEPVPAMMARLHAARMALRERLSAVFAPLGCAVGAR